MRRRTLLASAAGGLLLPARVHAQSRQIPVIAVLGSGAADAASSRQQMAMLEAGLRELGLLPGRDYAIVARWAGSDPGRFEPLAAELLAEKPAAVVVSTNLAALAVQKQSRSVAIVGTGLNAPVAAGLASSLGRPGGSVTGVSTMAEEILLKLFEMMREVLPAARRIAVLTNPTNPSNAPMVDLLARHAAASGVVLDAVEIRGPADLEAGFARLAGQPAAALFVLTDNSLLGLADTIVARALALGMPTVGGFAASFAESGALLAYGRDPREAFAGVARLLKKILSGTPPGELPFEQPTRFNLVVNLRTARALDIAIPAVLLATAAQVID
jgi:putative ABC transport system substrate-binding protein